LPRLTPWQRTLRQAAHQATQDSNYRAVYQENGAPPVRGTATIYVNGPAGPPQAKIGLVVAGLFLWHRSRTDPARRMIERALLPRQAAALAAG
jgi:hypothetical protein